MKMFLVIVVAVFYEATARQIFVPTQPVSPYADTEAS